MQLMLSLLNTLLCNAGVANLTELVFGLRFLAWHLALKIPANYKYLSVVRIYQMLCLCYIRQKNYALQINQIPIHCRYLQISQKSLQMFNKIFLNTYLHVSKTACKTSAIIKNY